MLRQSSTGELVYQQWVTLRSDKRLTLRVNSDWLQLFNGADLTGWAADGPAFLAVGPGLQRPSKWKVGDGILIGTGLPGLFSTGKKYADFHLRTVIKLPIGSNTRIVFRNSTEAVRIARGQRNTIDVSHHRNAPQDDSRHTEPSSSGPEDWVQLEIVAELAVLEVRIDGKTVIKKQTLLSLPQDRDQSTTADQES
jgi:hypothetical protein